MHFILESLKKCHRQGGAKVSKRMLEVPGPLKMVRLRHSSCGTIPAREKVYLRKRLPGHSIPKAGSQLQDTAEPLTHGQTVGRRRLRPRHFLIMRDRPRARNQSVLEQNRLSAREIRWRSLGKKRAGLSFSLEHDPAPQLDQRSHINWEGLRKGV